MLSRRLIASQDAVDLPGMARLPIGEEIDARCHRQPDAAHAVRGWEQKRIGANEPYELIGIVPVVDERLGQPAGRPFRGQNFPPLRARLFDDLAFDLDPVLNDGKHSDTKISGA